ncbi:Phospholipid hydroperoxide glutathione [Globisporangium polare]
MQAHIKSSGIKSVLEGDVFARLKLFQTLPESLQDDVQQFRAYVEQDKERIFQSQYTALMSLKSVYSVSGSDLVDAIIAWIRSRNLPARTSPHQNESAGRKSPTLAFSAANSDQTWEAPVEAAPTRTPGSITARLVPKEELMYAKKIAEALVLSGFLTPYKDDEEHLSFMAPDHYVQDDELLIPVAPSITDLKTTSVWNIVDGAVYARNMKRKAGLLGQINQGKSVYVVVNERTKRLYLFASDLARESISELSGATLDVQLDSSHFDFGVRVTHDLGFEKEKPELINAESKSVQKEFLNACVYIGAKYEGGDVKKLAEAEKSGLIVREAIPEYQNKRVDQAEEMRDVAAATATAASIAGLTSENNSNSPRAQGTREESASAQRRDNSTNEQSESANQHVHFGGENRISSDNKDRQGRSSPTSAEHHDQSLDKHLDSTVYHDHHGIVYPISPVHTDHHDRSADAKPTGDEQQHVKPSIAERLSTAYYGGGDNHDSEEAYRTSERQHQYQSAREKQTSSSEHQDRNQPQSVGAHSTSSEHQDHHPGSPSTSSEHQGRDERGSSLTSTGVKQTPSIGERVSSTIYGDSQTPSIGERVSHAIYGSSDASYPLSTENQHQSVGAAYPTTSEDQGNRAGSPMTSSEHERRSIGTVHPNSSEYQGRDERGSYQSSTSMGRNQEYQKPSIGERASTAIHGDSDRHGNTSAYQTSQQQKHHFETHPTSPENEIQPASPFRASSKYQDRPFDPEAEIPVNAPLMSKHHDQSAYSRVAPHQAP